MTLDVLITGANGFLGSALMRYLATKDGISVRGGVRSNSIHGSNLVGVGEIGPSTDWRSALDGIDVVVHTAAKVHVDASHDSNPEEFLRVNVEGTKELARQAAEAGVKRFVFISTIKVNGESTQPGRPFTAADEPEPTNNYSLSKRHAEEALQAVCRTSKMEHVIIRPPLIYGPGAAGNFAALAKWMDLGLPLPLAAVRNKRSLVSLTNICDLISVCLTHRNAAGKTLLVSDGRPVSTAELIECIAAAAVRRARLLPVPVPVLNLAAALLGKRAIAQRLLGSLEVDIRETRELLDWEPPQTLQEGLQAVMSKSPTANRT